MPKKLQVHRLDIESKLLGFRVEKIRQWSSVEDIIAYRDELQHRGIRTYLYLEADAADLQLMHFLQYQGFVLSEFRVYARLKLDNYDNYAQAFFPYVADFITDENHLQQACEMLEKQISDDRFSRETDALIPESFSRLRNTYNLKKSFRNYPNEWLVGMFNSARPGLEGFCSLGITGNHTALIYQQAVKPTRNPQPATEMLEALVFSLLKERGIRWVYSITTGFNIPEVNRRIRNAGFEAFNATVILRQIIQPS